MKVEVCHVNQIIQAFHTCITYHFNWNSMCMVWKLLFYVVEICTDNFGKETSQNWRFLSCWYVNWWPLWIRDNYILYIYAFHYLRLISSKHYCHREEKIRLDKKMFTCIPDSWGYYVIQHIILTFVIELLGSKGIISIIL